MVRLKKSLGQHHLMDGRLCHPLIAFLRPSGERVVEVGPGGGVLTEELARAGAHVWAFELDLAWTGHLCRRLAGTVLDPPPPVPPAIVAADALEIPWERMPAPTLAAGNLPYNVATPIIERVLRHPERIPRAGFLVQKEVGERLVAGPGDPAYGALSVLVALRATAHLLGTVRAGSFRPPPKVDGAFVGLVLCEPPMPPGEMPGLEATVRLAFARRRKTLKNSLGAGWGREGAAAALAAAGIDPRARAEVLGVEEFLALERARRDLEPSPGA